ncbi:DUF1499 domain-containing protein [Hyphococcus formosus]|uniref:DUF1499 domain-containing protein n=1 Tax=Hyphococcus formosus TaxID=3143534 RepID=UPI00398A9BAC
MKVIILIILALIILAVSFFVVLSIKSRSGSAPGLVDGALAPCPSSPNCVSSEKNADEAHRVAPFPIDVWEALPELIGKEGGVVVAINDNYIASELSSPLMKYVDDVEFRKAEDFVHVRSASRVGHSDLGTNRKRVEALRAALTAQK